MERLQKLIPQEMDQWGVCSFADVPLLSVRAKSRLPKDAACIIVFVFGYYTEEYPNRNISRYAIADDYHTILLPKLQALAEKLKRQFFGEEFIPFIDTSPIVEVAAAQLAGLGEIGKNGLLLNQRYGSYCFIGELVTTMKLKHRAFHGKLCTGCGACIAACPSGALTRSGFQKEKCRSFITQKKGELSDWEQKEIIDGNLAWGCDCCVDACPINRFAQKSRISAFYDNRVPILTTEMVHALCKTKAYGWRGQSVLCRNLSLLE